MLSDLPASRQPSGSNSCLSVCVHSVLRYRGHHVSLDQVAELCGEDVLGCMWDIALSGLSENGFDVEQIVSDHEEKLLEIVRGEVLDPEPVIITIIDPSLELSGDHAVVVVGLSDQMNAMGSQEYSTWTR
jgi:hypothetical protein